MEFDALRAGVETGGLINKDQIRILLCYIVNTVKEPLQLSKFCEILHAEGIANYFELISAVADLNAKELIIEDSKERDVYSLSKAGIETLSALVNTVPYSVRKDSYILAVKMLRRKKYQEQTVVDVKPLANGEYMLTCSVVEGKKEMMTVKLNLPDYDFVIKAKNIFWDSPEKVYSGILELLTDTKFNTNNDDIVFPEDK